MKSFFNPMLVGFCLICFIIFVNGSGENSNETDTIDCSEFSNSCGDCVKHASCFYCYSGNNSCFKYDTGSFPPNSKICSLKHSRWGVCWVNYEILIITMAVLGCVIIISTCCCIYCCCCRNKNSRKKYQAEEARIERETQERTAKHAERRAERQGRIDDIRRKYGLVKEDNPYQRFDA